MKIPTFLLSLFLSILITAFPIESQAFPIDFTPDMLGTGGLLTAKMPLEKLGPVNIPRGRFKIKGNWAEVSTVEEFQFDHYMLLSGPVINTQQTLENNNFEIIGYAYFCKGDWLSYLSPAIYQEIINTTNGDFVGNIVSIENDVIEMRLNNDKYQRIPLSSVKFIDSPRTFRFRITGTLPTGTSTREAYEADAGNVSVVQVNRQFRLTALSRDLGKQGDGDLSTAKLITIGTVINTIEIGQMTPFLVLGLLYHHLRTNGLRSEAPFIQAAQAQQAAGLGL